MQTLQVEKASSIGGTTAQSGGTIWSPMNYLMREAGIEDSREAALDYLRYVGGGYGVREYMEAFVDNAARVLEYLHTKADVAFRLVELPEFFYPLAPGSKEHGRVVTCTPFPAETLGAWRQKVAISVFHHGIADALRNLEHNPALGGVDGPSFGYSGPFRNSTDGRIDLWRKWVGAGLEPMLRKDEEQRTAGAGLAAYLFRAVLRRGIPVRTDTTVEELLTAQGRVVGLVVEQNGQREYIQARRGVVLALGGEGLGQRSGAGLGWRLAGNAGAELTTEVNILGGPRIRVPGEDYPNGVAATRGHLEMRMRHGLIVNRFGERFGNEYFFQDIGVKANHFEIWGAHRFLNIPCYLVFDRHLLEKYPFVGLPPGAAEAVDEWDWIVQGRTLADLAARLEMPADGLEATVARFNDHVRLGQDVDFGRDPTSLGALGKPPFYAVELRVPDPLRARTSVVVNSRAQVLHYATQEPIPALYGCGAMTANFRIWGMGYQAGFELMSGPTMGFLAAEHAAASSARP